MIEPNHADISLRRQCSLIGLNRATYYWQPAGESELNLKLMKMIDQEYTRAPFYGSRKFTVRLNQQLQDKVNRKRVVRLMQKMGLQAIYPHKNTSIPNQQHKKCPYLLQNLAVNHPDQVRAADITVNNGKEFAAHEEISRALEAETYFARPYFSWERGSNENTNGLIRQYIPKDADFRKLTNFDISFVEY